MLGSWKSEAEILTAHLLDARQDILELTELLGLVLTSLETEIPYRSALPGSILSSARKLLSTIQRRGLQLEKYIELQKQVDLQSLLSPESDSHAMISPQTTGDSPRTD